ncbi:MAG: hypothetical protein ABII06_13625 [Pseudomonadota bacterium]
MSEPVSIVVSVFILILGVSYLVQPKGWTDLSRDALEHPFRYYPMFLFLLVTGVTILTLHNQWAPARSAVITAMGWILVIKSALFLIVPGLAKRFGSWSDKSLGIWIRAAGVVFTAVGLWLLIPHFLTS